MAPTATAAGDEPASGRAKTALEKDLRELERLLKVDQAGGGNAGGAAASASTVKEQLRSVLRKLMEAYFTPLNVHKRETRSLLALLQVALKRHAEVFTGSAAFCVRMFAHLLPLLTCAGLSEKVTDSIVWTLCQLVTQLSNANDPKVFASVFVGISELLQDASEALEIQLSSSTRGFKPGHHDGHGNSVVLCCFKDALRHVYIADGGPGTPPLRSGSNANTRTTRGGDGASKSTAAKTTTNGAADAAMDVDANDIGLMVEVNGVDAAVTLASAACKLLNNALRLSPQAAAGYLSPSHATAMAYVCTAASGGGGGGGAGLANDSAAVGLRHAALAALRGVATELPSSVLPAETCLRHLAVALRERAAGGGGAVPPAGRERDAFDAELAACINAVLDVCDDAASAAAAEPLSEAAAAVITAGEGVVADALRAASLRALTACVNARGDAVASTLASLLPHAGSEDVADALVECLEPAFKSRGAGVESGNASEAERAKRRRVSAGVDGWVGGGGRGARDAGAGPGSSSTRDGDEAALAWIEECVITALSQLAPGPSSGHGSGDRAAAAPKRARCAAGLARVAAAAAGGGAAKLLHAGISSMHEWLKWTRRAHDTGDGAAARAFAAVVDAADALLRARPTEETSGNAAFHEDDLTVDVLLWPWSTGAEEAPADAARAAKVASLRAVLSATAARAKATTNAAAAARRTLSAAVSDKDPGTRAAAACATPAAHLLAAQNVDTQTPLKLVAKLAENAKKEPRVRAAVAVAVGGLAAAGAALAGKRASDVALRRVARDCGRRAIKAAAAVDGAAERDAAAEAFDVAVVRAITSESGGGAQDDKGKSILPVAAAGKVLTAMMSAEEDAAVATAALNALPRVLDHAQRGTETLKGAAALSAAATPLALHPDASVRAALRDAAPSLAARGALLDAETVAAGADESDDQAVVAAGLSLLQRLKTNVEDASDAATREAALQTFAAAAAAIPYPDALTAALIVILHRLDDKDAGVRAAAVGLVRAAASRRGVRPRELLLGNRIIATHLGVQLPNAPGLLSTLAEALLGMPERNVLVELLPAAVPRLVENQDVATLKAYATRLGPEYNVAGILQDWCYTAIADLINSGAERTPEEVEQCRKFLVSQTGCELEVLVADHKKELMRALIRSAGADDAADPQTEAERLQQVLGTLAKLVSSRSGPSDASPPSVPDFLRPHFTWLVMGDANDRSGDAAAQRRFLRSLTIMVHLIGPHLPQFAPKVMAHLASALERPSTLLRQNALAAWSLVVKQLAMHAPDHLRRVAGRVVVAMLPHLPDGASGGGGATATASASASGGASAGRRGSLGGGDDGATATGVDNAQAAAEVIDELVLRAGAKCMRGHLARLPMLPACERLARANAAVSKERGEVPLPSLLATLTDGAEDESQAVRATALGELRRALRADPSAVSALLAGAGEDGVAAPAVVGRLVAALLRCCAGENRTILSRRAQRLAAQCFGELGAVDPGRIDMPTASAESLTTGTTHALAAALLCDHIARTVRGANDVDMLDASALAVQEILVHVGCRPAMVRAEDVVASAERSLSEPSSHGHGGGGEQRLPDGATVEGEAFWRTLPEDVRVLLAPGLTSMYCLTQKPAKPQTKRPLYAAPGGPTFRRWMYAWCRALAVEATGPDAPLFAACSAGVFRHDTRTMLFLLPRMVLDALACGGDGDGDGAANERLQNVGAEIMAVLHDAAGEAWGEGDIHQLTQRQGSHGEQAELAAQAVFTLLDQLTAWKEETSAAVAALKEKSADERVARTLENAGALLESVPRELLARAALKCGAPARALLYFEDHLRARKNVLNQAALRSGEPEGGGLDDASAAFLAATHHALAEPDALEAISRMRPRASGGHGAVAAARRRAEDALLQHEQAGEWTEALTHYESASQRNGGATHNRSLGGGETSSTTTALDPAEWGRLRCLQGLGHLRALEREADALIQERPAARAELAEAGAAAAWRLGRWDSLEGFLDVLDANGGAGGGGGGAGGGFGGANGRPGGEAAIGRVLLALHRRDAEGVTLAATAARDAVITPLAAAAMEGSYRRAHPAIVQLHLIREAEEAMRAVSSLSEKTPGRARGMDLLRDWEARLDLTPAALATREPILALRRATYAALDARDAGAYTWLAQAKLCRHTGHHGAAQLALLEARAALESAPVDVVSGRRDGRPSPGMALAVEQAKLLWATGRQHRAVVEIQEALDDVSLRETDTKTASHAMLRLARWSAATGQRQKTDVLHIYSNVLKDQQHTEKANFHVAKYLDDLLKDAQKREQQRAAMGGGADGEGGGQRRRKNQEADEKSLDYVDDIITRYATSLRYGHSHVYESLPRMLTLWFDVGAAAAAHEATAARSSGRGAAAATTSTLTAEQQKERRVAKKATDVLKQFSGSLPLYTWLPALPQLTSRLCHPHAEVRQLIHQILYRLVKNFPNQVLWSMTAMARSTHPERAEAAARILQKAKQDADASMRPLFDQSSELAAQLIKLCKYEPPKGADRRAPKTFSLRAEFPKLASLVEGEELGAMMVMVPGQSSLTPSLPPATLRNAAQPNLVPTVSEWSAFPSDVAVIASIEDEVAVLSSLQKPKKLTVIGSDGHEYAFLCKPKDDLRKDLRMMEFTTMLNRLLARDPSSRKRRLYLRTFAVIPLTEDCGLIEWVPNTTGLRHVLQALYVQDGLYHKRTLVEVKEMHERLKSRPLTWMSEILEKFPPVFHRWFLNRWKDRPAAWHGARTAFSHTAAVWSMVGHVVGLGDRHGENILLDQESGDCVHVDFSCLFDKGLELETPEMVPFRLTQNIVDGLGAGGYEGTFMRVCEITLGVLRSHREALMSVLETFVHDPLVEWAASRAGPKTSSGKSKADEGVEIERGKDALEKIRSRLEGVVVGVGAAPSLPLSTQGQTRRLIEEATSRKHLGSMYIWWMPWF